MDDPAPPDPDRSRRQRVHQVMVAAARTIERSHDAVERSREAKARAVETRLRAQETRACLRAQWRAKGLLPPYGL